MNNLSSEGFGQKIEGVELAISEIANLIEIRVKWHKSLGKTCEEDMAYYFIVWSRYSGYWRTLLIFEFVYRGKFSKEEYARFKIQLAKLLFIYSVKYGRTVNRCHTFIRNLMKDMYKSPEPAEIINKINAKIQTHDSSDGVGEFEMKINEPIAGIPKSKYLLCRLSAMLNEDFRTKDVENIERLQKILCNTDNSTDIDIEHIQSYHDIDKSLRDSIWEEWGNEINSIGNLVILERKKNRSISNSEYQKKRECYKNSVFSIVKEISSNNEFWTKQHAERRRKNESEKIMNYIFEL